ncbi:MAG: lysophospholipid acyltransferase family protein [Polyangiales bacterium]
MSLERPEGYVAPPPPPLSDVLRTVRVAAIDLPRHLARLALHRVYEAPSTTTEEGLRQVGRAFGRTLARLGVELEVEHEERVPREGGLNLMWNQESHLDHLVLAAAIPRPFFSLFNNAVARVPFYGSHMRTTGHVHVDRNDEAQWRPAIAAAAERVASGECVLVSPEGTRSWDGRLLPMKRGAFLLATTSRRPIVCCTVVGGHARMPRGSAWVRAGKIRVVFSEPIDNDGDAEHLAEAVATTFDRIKDEWSSRP